MSVHKIRVLYIHASEMIGGGNRVLLGLFDEINRDRFEPWSLIPAEGPIVEELRNRSIPYIVEDVITCGTSGGKLSQLWAAASIYSDIRNQQFSILHAQDTLGYRLPSFLL